MDPGMMGIIIGGVLGLAGGILGTYFSIKNTLGQRERTFMVRIAAITWLAVTAFIVALFFIPQPYNWLLWLPYGFALVFGIRWSNRRQAQIRAEESPTASNPTRK